MRRKRTAALTLALALLAAGCTGKGHTNGSAGTNRAPRISGWLHTRGTAILDSRGATIRLLGVDDGRMVPGIGGALGAPDSCGNRWNLPSASEAANLSAWGFNFVRLGISWANLEPEAPTASAGGALVHHWNFAYLQAVDQAVRLFEARGIAVVLDMHQAHWSPAFTSVSSGRTGRSICEGTGLPGWLYPNPGAVSEGVAVCDFFADRPEAGVPLAPQEGLSAAWGLVAARFAKNTAVIGTDLFNEPRPNATCPSSALGLQAFYTKIGDAVRSADPHVLLMFQDNAYESYKRHGFALEGPPQVRNAVYSWHFYPRTWSAGEPALAAHVARARAWGVPFWVGEFDAFGQSNDRSSSVETASSDLGRMMGYCRSAGISWSLWEYGGGGRNASLVVPGTNEPKPALLRGLRLGF